jgi:hypothetical protein
MFDGLTDVQIRAARRLRRIAAEIMLAVGRLGLTILHAVTVDGMTLGKIATSVMGNRSERNMDFMGKLLRRALDELALILWALSRAHGRSICRSCCGRRPRWPRWRRRELIIRPICSAGHKNNTDRVPKS